MKRIIFAIIMAFIFTGSLPAQLADIKATILYDNYVVDKSTKADWGFSCLVEGAERTILFDTGTNPKILWKNINELGVDVNSIDYIVLSHNHGDHTGGLFSILEKNSDVTVYLLSSFDYSFRKKISETGADLVVVNEPVEICKDVYSTGKMGSSIKEQSLILNTIKGEVIITGCSHQGIVEILEKSKEMNDKDIYMVFGGFHLMDYPSAQVEEMAESFKEMGVEYCGATHCTGREAIKVFKDAYGKKYIKMGTGKVVEI